MNFQIRLAAEPDLPTINAIYNHYVHTSTATYQDDPTTTEERLAWFHHHGSEHPITVAATDTHEILAWASLSRFHRRSAYRFTVEDSIYVRHDLHGQGLGRALLADLLHRAADLGHQQVIALISADQARSIELHRRAGFTRAGRLHRVGLKFDQWLDVVYMQWSAAAKP